MEIDPYEELAKGFLADLDKSLFDQAYLKTAAFVQSTVSKEEWKRKLGAVRVPLGEVLRRDVTSRSSSKSLPGMPDGSYVTFVFETVFRAKKQALETVILDVANSGSILGYFVS